MFCLEINTKIKGSKISGILFLNFHSWNCSRILENSFREFSFPGIKKSWKILSWKKIVLEFSQNNLYFPWNLQFWNFPFLEFSTPGILSWNFLFLESYFTEFSCYQPKFNWRRKYHWSESQTLRSGGYYKLRSVYWVMGCEKRFIRCQIALFY